MPSEPLWLSADDLIETNRALVTLTGETFHLRDLGLLESAAAKPCNHFAYVDDDLCAMAAALLAGVVHNHPFEQGNKRTALTAAMMFLDLNGLEWFGDTGAGIAQMVLDLIDRKIDETDVAAYLRENCSPR